MLVVIPTEHILRGFLIENTSEKGRIYLWKVVTPLYRRMSSVFLDYSTRIPESGREIYVNDTKLQESVATLRKIIAEHIESLEGIRTPEDFLRHVGRMIGNTTINFRFDLALTYYLTGDLRQCMELIRAVKIDVDKLERNFRMPIDDLVIQAARQIESDASSFGRLLEYWENDNVVRLRLQPSRSNRTVH